MREYGLPEITSGRTPLESICSVCKHNPLNLSRLMRIDSESESQEDVTFLSVLTQIQTLYLVGFRNS